MTPFETETKRQKEPPKKGLQHLKFGMAVALKGYNVKPMLSPKTAELSPNKTILNRLGLNIIEI